MKREGLAEKIIEGSKTKKKGTWQSLVKIAYSWKPCVGYLVQISKESKRTF